MGITWRELLAQMIALPEERSRIVREVGLSRNRVLESWIQGTAIPQKENIRRLLQAIPLEYQEQMRDLMSIDFPLVESHLLKAIPTEVAPSFVWKIHAALSETAAILRGPVIRGLVLLRMAQHLDSEHSGVALVVARLLQDENGLFSLRLDPAETFGTVIWKKSCLVTPLLLREDASFLISLLQKRESAFFEEIPYKELTWLHASAQAMTLSSFPILRCGKTAGLLLCVTHSLVLPPNELCEHYTALLSLAYDDSQFYGDIHFGVPDELLYKRLEAILAVLSPEEVFGYIEAHCKTSIS